MAINFFKGFFGKAAQDSVRTTVENVPLLIEKEFLLERGALEEYSAKKIAEVKYLHSRAAGLVKVVSEKALAAKPNERLNKAALTAKTQLVLQLSRLLDKLNPSERGAHLADARHYAGESYSLLASEIVSLRKNIAYTSFYLKEEMRALGSAMQDMADLFHEMNGEFSKAGQLFEFEKISAKTAAVSGKKKGVQRIGEKIEECKKTILEKEALLAQRRGKIGEKKSGSEMKKVADAESEMNSLMAQKQELKTEISALLLNIDRPLQRFKQLVDSGRWKMKAEGKEMLDLFIINPMLALKKDPKAEVFKGVLAEIVKAVEEGAIELKEKEKEKRLAALQEIINFDFFGKVFWKMNEIQKKQAELNKLLEKSPAKKELALEESGVLEIEKEIFALRVEISNNEKLLASAKKELDAMIEEIRVFAEGALKKKVVFEEE